MKLTVAFGARSLSPRRWVPIMTEEVNPSTRCCEADAHPWDKFAVPATWFPPSLRCLIVGESPGDKTSVYIYDNTRPVAVRTILLEELRRHRIIEDESLDAFRDAGFLFDHAIRCRLPDTVVKEEWRRAKRYNSNRAAAASHLRPLLDVATRVWVMGYIARNAIAHLCIEFPRDPDGIGKAPYPREVASRFFVSRYVLHASMDERAVLFARLHRFLDPSASSQCSACVGV